MKYFFTPEFLRIAVIIGGFVIAISGFVLLALRRRDEILENYFTVNDEDLEHDFFSRRAIKRAAPRVKNQAEVHPDETTEQTDEAEWGDVQM